MQEGFSWWGRADFDHKLNSSSSFLLLVISAMHTAVRYSAVFVTGLCSLLAGANVVHQLYKPDMTLKIPNIPTERAEKDHGKK